MSGPITTEQHWLDSVDPEAMARLLEAGDVRRWQSFACACCWRILPMLDDRSRQAVAVAERDAAGLASAEEVEEARHLAHTSLLAVWRPGDDACFEYAALAAQYALVHPQRAYVYAALATGGGRAAERRVQADLLRDIFGNPFRTLRFDVSWRTPTVLAIAEDIYHNDAFSEMPVLGDALEDAGCDDHDVLDHARHDRPHVRGCWLVEALLGRAGGVDSA
jgi:hypothetical protein